MSETNNENQPTVIYVERERTEWFTRWRAFMTVFIILFTLFAIGCVILAAN